MVKKISINFIVFPIDYILKSSNTMCFVKKKKKHIPTTEHKKKLDWELGVNI